MVLPTMPLVVVNQWPNSIKRDCQRDFVMTTSLNQPVVFDGRNLFDPVRMKRDGFAYYAIGRGESVVQFA